MIEHKKALSAWHLKAFLVKSEQLCAILNKSLAEEVGYINLIKTVFYKFNTLKNTLK
jgi:hypothetical protein